MKVGTMFLGRVEALGHESVQTKFFVFGVPLVPIASYYATAEHRHGVTGIEIPVHGASVLAGYVRIASFLAAMTFGIFGWVDRHHTPYELWIGFVVSTAIWAVSMFWLGRLSPAERVRRMRLRAVTGLGAPPELLPDHVRSDVEARLAEAWKRVGGGAEWKERLRSNQARAAEAGVLYALAEYERDPELVAMARRQMV